MKSKDLKQLRINRGKNKQRVIIKNFLGIGNFLGEFMME